MGYYWEIFIEDYRDVISEFSLKKILEAFYYYSRGTQRGREDCDKLMKQL